MLCASRGDPSEAPRPLSAPFSTGTVSTGASRGHRTARGSAAARLWHHLPGNERLLRRSRSLLPAASVPSHSFPFPRSCFFNLLLLLLFAFLALENETLTLTRLGWMDGWTDGWREGRMDRWMEPTYSAQPLLPLSSQQPPPPSPVTTRGTWGCCSIESQVQKCSALPPQQLLVSLQAVLCTHALCQPLLLYQTFSLRWISVISFSLD